MSEDVHTYRGRTLAEILPRIREELGDDAVVLRRREGLAGGVGGFFAKAFVEVEARRGEGSDQTPATGGRLDVRDGDPATPDGLPLPGVAEPAPRAAASTQDAAPMAWPAGDLPEPAVAAAALSAAAAAVPGAMAATAPSGFAKLLADAYAGGFSGATAVPGTPEPPPLPQHAPSAAESASPAPAEPQDDPFVPDYVPREMEREALPALAAQENTASAEAAPEVAEAVVPQTVNRTKAVAAAEQRLVESGCSHAFAASVVAEAVSHGLPFATPRSIKRLVREALVRRVPVPAPRGERAVVAIVGAAGSGRTTVAGRLAAAYAAGSDLEVRAATLGTPSDAFELAQLAGHERTVTATTSAAVAEAAAGAGPRAMVVIDTCPLRTRDDAGLKALRRELRVTGATEVHLVLPATTSAPAARSVLDATRGLKPAGIVLSHADEAPAGAVLELAATSGLPITWQTTAAALGPADPTALAQEILP